MIIKNNDLPVKKCNRFASTRILYKEKNKLMDILLIINLAHWLDFLVLSEAAGTATSAAAASSTPVTALSAPVAAKLPSATIASTAIATSLVGSALLSAPATAAAAASLAFGASWFHPHCVLRCFNQE